VGAGELRSCEKRAYQGRELVGVKVERDGRVPDTAVEVGKKYEAEAHELANRRVALAGWRLLERLERVLTKP